MPDHPDKNTAALTALISPARRLARILARNPDHAEDLCQEALLRVWARLAGGGRISELRPYLMTVLRHSSRRPAPQTREISERDLPPTPEAGPIRITCAQVMAAIARLPAEQGELIAELVRTGASYDSLARSRGIPVGTVMSRLARARARLRDDLALEEGAAVAGLLAGAGH